MCRKGKGFGGAFVLQRYAPWEGFSVFYMNGRLVVIVTSFFLIKGLVYLSIIDYVFAVKYQISAISLQQFSSNVYSTFL